MCKILPTNGENSAIRSLLDLLAFTITYKITPLAFSESYQNKESYIDEECFLKLDQSILLLLFLLEFLYDKLSPDIMQIWFDRLIRILSPRHHAKLGLDLRRQIRSHCRTLLWHFKNYFKFLSFSSSFCPDEYHRHLENHKCHSLKSFISICVFS